MMATVGVGDRFICLRICNSTSIALYTLSLKSQLFLIMTQISETDRRRIESIQSLCLCLFLDLDS